MSDLSFIIKQVRLSEKAVLLSDSASKYVFEVCPKANKLQIRKAVEVLFGKKVVSVNTMNQFGKIKRKRTVHAGKRSDWKKAVVTLAEGEKIDFV